MPETSSANVTGTATIGRSDSETVVFVTPPKEEEADESTLAQLKETIETKKAQARVTAQHAAMAGLKTRDDPLNYADHVDEAVAMSPGESVASNLAAGAMTLLITLMIVLLAALVGGKFAAAVPSDSTFSTAINTMTDNAGTAFVIFGVSLLAIPTVAVLGYMITRLGGFIGFGGAMGGAGGGGLRRR